MNRDRFSLETIAYLVVGIVFLWVFLSYFQAAFPVASIRLEVTRDEALAIAADFLRERGFDLSGYESAVIFNANGTGAVFLQKTQGMERANELMAGDAPIWRWSCRWFRSAEKEAFRVYVDPSGQIVRFHHEIEEDREGAEIPEQEAEALAAGFLTAEMGIDLMQYERVEASSKRQENRTDHHFEWKMAGFEIPWKESDPEAGSGSIRILADVYGDEVGQVQRYFRTPEAFQRDHQKIESRGALLAVISLLMMFLTGVAALVVFIIKAGKGPLPWRFAMVFALLILVLFVMNSVNLLPMVKANYDTAIDYGVFLGIGLTVTILLGVIYGILIFFTGASGAALTREIWPNSLGTLEKLMQGRIFTRSFFFASIRGYALAFFFLGYVTLFYIIGRRYFEVFVQAEGPYSNLLGTFVPWLFPLSISLLAAVSEEFTSRLFSITFLKRYLKWTPAALIIPAAIWAFGHATYPVFPVYVRGIELTIAGVIFGLFFLRFNIMTCIIAHYVIDAIFFAMPLLKSGNPYYVTSGWIVCGLAAVPLILGIPGLLRDGKEPRRPAGQAATP